MCVSYSIKSESVVADGQTSSDIHNDGTVHVPQRPHLDIRTTADTTAGSDKRGCYAVCVSSNLKCMIVLVTVCFFVASGAQIIFEK